MPYKIWRRLIFTQQKIRKYYSVVLVTKKGYENYVISALNTSKKIQIYLAKFFKSAIRLTKFCNKEILFSCILLKKRYSNI